MLNPGLCIPCVSTIPNSLLMCFSNSRRKSLSEYERYRMMSPPGGRIGFQTRKMGGRNGERLIMSFMIRSRSPWWKYRYL